MEGPLIVGESAPIHARAPVHTRTAPGQVDALITTCRCNPPSLPSEGKKKSCMQSTLCENLQLLRR